jgi:hypothetical protein
MMTVAELISHLAEFGDHLQVCLSIQGDEAADNISVDSGKDGDGVTWVVIEADK